MSRVRDQLDQRGTLEVLRIVVEMLGLKQPLQIAQFRPTLALNEEILTRYGANRLRVVRQVRYSLHSENSIDFVLFLDGLPLATAELKTDFTQTVHDAIGRYRFDRARLRRARAEPILAGRSCENLTDRLPYCLSKR